jgi:hypothetical protein
LEILRGDPQHLINFLRNWQLSRGDSTALAVAQAMADWIRTDSLAAKKFFERVISSGEVSSAAELLSLLLIRVQDSPQHLAILKKLVATLPIDKLSKDLIETFSRLTDNLEERYIIAILDSLARNAPPEERQKRARVLEMYEKLLKEKLRRDNLVRFYQKAREFDSSKKLQPVMVIGKLFYPGFGYNTLSDEGDRLLPFVQELARAFAEKKAYEVVVDKLSIKDSITTEEVIAASQNVRFAELPPIPDHLRNRPALALVGAYFYTQKTGELIVRCRIADAGEGIVLETKREEFNLNKLKGDRYREKVRDFADTVAVALENKIKRALDLETILNNPLVWDPKKMIAEQFHGIRFGIERSGTLDTVSLAKIKRVQIKEPYWSVKDPASTGPRLFLQSLNEQVTKSYPSNILQTTTANAIVLSGRIVSETPFLEIKNVMTRGADTLALVKVNLQFMHSGQDLTPLDAESGVEIVMLNLEALIPRRPSGKPPIATSSLGPVQKISKWQSVPSLLFAGTSQLIIADRFETKSIKRQKRWGWLFLTAEAALLGAAFAFDQQAVRNVDNSALQTRNGLLIGAGGLGVVSAIKAWINIGSHNKVK